MANDLSDVIFASGNALLEYSVGGWDSSQLSQSGVSHSLRCSSTPGASLSLTYEYVSIAVWAFYLPDRDLPQVHIEIDGDYIPTDVPPVTEDGQSLWHEWELAYATPLEEKKNHTTRLVVVDASEERPFCFNMFEVMAPTHISQFVAEPGSGNTTSTSTPDSSRPPPGARRLSVGATVGAVVGAIALTLLICVLFFYWRRSRQHRYLRTSLDDNDSGRDTPTTRQARGLSLRSLFIQRFFRENKPAELVWVETRPPLSPASDRPRSSSPASMKIPWAGDLSEKHSRPPSEHTADIRELGQAATSLSSAEREPHSAAQTHGPIHSPSSTGASIDSLVSPTRSMTV
ncbi:hypothetical protein C8Q76DRAFT_304847 [Earliella scabrosa]|nr:hypothetical protein C8Q76DRAFT_304847 [Earliella scabrosa]